jgi:hypothetical protein
VESAVCPVPLAGEAAGPFAAQADSRVDDKVMLMIQVLKLPE